MPSQTPSLDRRTSPTATRERQGREEFLQLYAELSPLLYGIIVRIAESERSSEKALKAVFLCMYKKGVTRLTPRGQLRKFLPIVFSCVEETLRDSLPSGVIAERIALEKARMLARIRGAKS